MFLQASFTAPIGYMYTVRADHYFFPYILYSITLVFYLPQFIKSLLYRQPPGFANEESPRFFCEKWIFAKVEDASLLLVNKTCGSPRMLVSALHLISMPRMPLSKMCSQAIHLTFSGYIMGCNTSLTIRLHIYTLLMGKSFCKLTVYQEDTIFEVYISKQATSLNWLAEFFRSHTNDSLAPLRLPFLAFSKEDTLIRFLMMQTEPWDHTAKANYSVSILKLVFSTI